MASRPGRSQAPWKHPACPRSFGNREGGGMTTEPAKLRTDDPFAGLPLLIVVSEATKLLGISRVTDVAGTESP